MAAPTLNGTILHPSTDDIEHVPIGDSHEAENGRLTWQQREGASADRTVWVLKWVRVEASVVLAIRALYATLATGNRTFVSTLGETHSVTKQQDSFTYAVNGIKSNTEEYYDITLKLYEVVN